MLSKRDNTTIISKKCISTLMNTIRVNILTALCKAFIRGATPKDHSTYIYPNAIHKDSLKYEKILPSIGFI